MHSFKRIFVAVDFSPAADEALRQAHRRATLTGANLAVCHIIPNELRSNLLFPQLTQAASLAVPREIEKVSEQLQIRVNDVTGRSADDVTILVDHGNPYAEILTAAENWNADLITVGSHGMTSAVGVLLGNVTNKIIRYAHATVLVTRLVPAKGAIVAGTDFSDPALPAIAAAVDESCRTGDPLVVAHSIDIAFSTASHGAMAFGGPAPVISARDMQLLEKNAEDQLRDALKQLGATGEIVVTNGAAAPALMSLAKQRNARLLVVGTKGLTGLSRVLLGSVAEKVAAEAECSVLITRLH